MLWLMFALLLLGTLAILILPLWKRASDEAPARIDYDIVVYRSQLAEIKQEVERGLMSEAQADAARAEIHRRMLAAEDAGLEMAVAPARADSPRARLASVGAIAVFVTAGAAIMYGMLGSPNLPGQAYASRLTDDPEIAAAASAEQLEAVLKTNPSGAGYRRLAELYFSARKYAQAAAADRQAIALGVADAATWSELGEAIVMTNGGAVAPEALQAFANALTAEPRSERARFYIGLAEAQIGNAKQAVAIWRDLEKDSDPGAPWLQMLREHIKVFAKEGGFDPASVPPSPPSPAVLTAAVAAMTSAMKAHPPSGTTAPDAAPATAPAAAPASGDDQDTMIRAMVARLAERMTKTPDDVDGWQRLARAYNVLGEHDKAREAIDHAVRLKPADVAVQLALADIQKAAAAPGDETPADFIATMRGILKLDAANVSALYYVGVAELKAGHAAKARELWTRAQVAAAADEPLAGRIRERLDALSGKKKAN